MSFPPHDISGEYSLALETFEAILADKPTNLVAMKRKVFKI
jgi:hypothetical protein